MPFSKVSSPEFTQVLMPYPVTNQPADHVNYGQLILEECFIEPTEVRSTHKKSSQDSTQETVTAKRHSLDQIKQENISGLKIMDMYRNERND